MYFLDDDDDMSYMDDITGVINGVFLFVILIVLILIGIYTHE